jgi:hypothetical protein
MKRHGIPFPGFALALFVLISAPSSFGASDSASIGTVTLLQGAAQAVNPAGALRTLEKGSPVYLSDRVTTSSGGSLTVELQDQTVFHLGPGSEAVLDEYVYQANQENGRVQIDFAKGVFRFVTGKIAKKHPENIEVEFPTGSMGIRGTNVMGRIEDKTALVILDFSEMTAFSSHGIVLRNELNGVIYEAEIVTAGMGSWLKPGEKPSEPFTVSKEILNQIQAELSPGPAPSPVKEKEKDTEDDAGGSADAPFIFKP